MSKPVILTGLRANNDLHIGNYLGALLPMIDMAKQKAGKYQVNLFVPDLHSFTTPIDHGTLQEAIMNNLRVYAAAGLPLDNPDVYIYRQSYISAHSELTWILDCFTGMGEMKRMTQFKDKSTLGYNWIRVMEKAIDDLPDRYPAIQKAAMGKPLTKEDKESLKVFYEVLDSRLTEKATVGLFNYPILMAADILLYGATYVPVGDDQTQHLEFTRDIGQRMNSKFGDLFLLPKSAKGQHEFFGKDQGLRIKDLTDPSKKMSKSDETGKGVIFLKDTPDVARKKVMSATTDSIGQINYDYDNQPGISSLIDLLALLKGIDKQKVIDQYQGQTMYGPLKTEVADVVASFLTDFQTKLAAVDDKILLAKLEADEKLMNEQANATLLKVQQAVGLRSKK
jgi:tryptophanyl-tRNA synthetase